MARAIWGLTKLFFQTFQIVGQAIFELSFEAWNNREVEHKDVPRYPRKLSKTELETRRLRKEQELIKQFKRSNNEKK